jgi:hypothetical protein
MALHRGDDWLAHQPGRHLEFQLRMEMCVSLGRVGTPIIRAGFFGADIITGAETAPTGAQQHNAGRRVRLRHAKASVSAYCSSRLIAFSLSGRLR